MIMYRTLLWMCAFATPIPRRRFEPESSGQYPPPSPHIKLPKISPFRDHHKTYSDSPLIPIQTCPVPIFSKCLSRANKSSERRQFSSRANETCNNWRLYVTCQFGKRYDRNFVRLIMPLITDTCPSAGARGPLPHYHLRISWSGTRNRRTCLFWARPWSRSVRA